MRSKYIVLDAVVAVTLALVLFDMPSRAANETHPAKVEFTCEEGKLTLNASTLVLPCELKVITTVLGEPDRNPEGGLGVTKPIPIWDKLGIVCHLNDDKKVEDISIRLGENPYSAVGEFAPKGMFTGGLTVDGVKFEGVVTFNNFWEKRTPSGKKLRDGELVEYDNGNSLSLECKEPGKGQIWELAVFVRTKR